ncbi:MAG TPA: carboxypeptidase-like regulatory domain-containing protein, partial [Actinomycetota bacterium]|nr:carboxypeptidase-like regulatory domain-containing protein [Actinomycetota bacterium]
EGWVNKPLAGKTLQITAGGTTVEATTGADGSFSAPTGLLPGTYEVTVTWPGDQDYQPATVTRQITVS